MRTRRWKGRSKLWLACRRDRHTNTTEQECAPEQAAFDGTLEATEKMCFIISSSYVPRVVQKVGRPQSINLPDRTFKARVVQRKRERSRDSNARRPGYVAKRVYRIAPLHDDNPFCFGRLSS